MAARSSAWGDNQGTVVGLEAGQRALFVGSLCRYSLLFYSLLLRLERVEKTGLGRAFLDLSIYLSDYIYSLWFY